MYLVGLGVFLLLLKMAELGAVGQWSWIAVLSPFGLAVVWWAWADTTGYTKRRAMDKMEERKVARRRKHLVDMGMDERGRRHQPRK